MEKRLKFNLLIFLIVIMTFVGCNGDEPNPSPNPLPDNSYNVDSVKDIALAIANLQPSIEICREVHSVVRKAVEYGLDESYYLVELLGKGEKISKSAEISREFLSKLESLPQSDKIRQLFSAVSDKLRYMRHYQIYWPYSKNWDGKTMPTISFNRYRTVAVHQNIGYRLTETGIEEVRVYDDYAKRNPVWIINFNPIPYEEYPDFSIYNWVKTKRIPYSEETGLEVPERIVQYCKTYDDENYNEERPDYVGSIHDVDLSKDVLSLYLREFYFDYEDKKLNSLFTGGSHYICNLPVTNKEEIKDASRWYFDSLNGKRLIRTEVSSIRFVVLREDMQSGTRKFIDGILSWWWLNYEKRSNLVLIQEFGGETMVLGGRYFGYYFDPPVLSYGNLKISDFSFDGDILYSYDDILLCYEKLERDKDKFEDFYVTENVSFELGITKGKTPVIWQSLYGRE